MLYRQIPAADSLPVIIIDDDFLFGGSLEIALRSRGWDAHRISATDQEGILAQTRRFPAAVALLDLTLGVGPSATPFYGTALVPELIRQGKRVLIVRDSADTAATAAAIAAGAIGELPRSSSVLDTVVDAVARACLGLPVMTEVEQHRWLLRHREFEHERGQLVQRLERLSSLELRIFQLMGRGHRASAVAKELTESIPIVRTHINSALRKLEVDSQLEAVSLLHSARLCGVLEFLTAIPPTSERA
jgi:DNA-binding NarL/FixJ family response regulator